jgi:dsDNA-specific endonuclease/ATPase MutS2
MIDIYHNNQIIIKNDFIFAKVRISFESNFTHFKINL